MLRFGGGGAAGAVAAAAAARLLRCAPPHAHSLAVRAARASLHTVAHARVAARAPMWSVPAPAAAAAWPLVQRAWMSYADVGRVEEFKAIRGRKKQEKSGEASGATPVSTRQMLSTMLHFLWPAGETGLRTRVVTSLGMLFAAKLASVSVPMLFKEAVDAVSAVATNPAVAAPVGILLGYGAARAASGLFGEARSAVFSTVAHSAIRKMSVQVFEHLHNLDHHFHLTRQTGALSRAIDRGSRGINFVLTSMLFNIFPTALELAMVSALLVHQCGWSYAGVSVGTIGVYTWFTLAVTSKRVAIRKEMNQKDNEANNRVIDSLINFETVKYFNNEKLEVQRYDESLRGYERAAVKTAESLAWLNFGQGAIFTAGMTAMMIMAANDITAGLMSVGSLVMVNGLLFQMSFPLHFLGTVYREMRQSLIDMELMFRLTSNKPSVTDHAGSVDLPADKPYTIEFDNVHFRYDDERAILNGVTFTVPAGKTVAIVGPSGCGKSTIMRLVYRFYDVDEGAIRVNGVDVRDIRVASLRSRIGVVPQDTVLFNNTIFYNIAYGDPSAPRSDVVAAATAAQIDKVIQTFPGGYDTPVGERGLMMSGGEKQRVSIARTILKRPGILLCDEATSSLDSHTEAEIMKSLYQLGQDRTAIFIAHRLSTVVDADEIIVLDQGRVVERGTHAQLLGTPGSKYGELWNRQRAQIQRGEEEPQSDVEVAPAALAAGSPATATAAADVVAAARA